MSNELGRGNAKATKFSIKVILTISACLGVICWILCLIFGRQISYLFTTNEEIAEEVSKLSVLLSFSLLLNSVQPVLSGKCFFFENLEKKKTIMITKGAIDFKVLQLKSYSCCGKKMYL